MKYLFVGILFLGIAVTISPVLAERTSVIQPTAQMTNGVVYFDGTNVNNNQNFIFTGTKLGIGSTSPFALFSILDSIVNPSSAIFTIASSTAAGNSTSTLFNIANTGQVTQGGNVPTIATSTGAGTFSNASVLGTPQFQTVTVTTGSLPVANATIATVTLPSNCPTRIIPVFTPANASSTQIATSSQSVYATSTTQNTYSFVSGYQVLNGSTTLIWNVFTGCY